MARPRVTLRALMAAVLLGAVALASLRYASPAWAGAVLLATQVFLAVAILGVVYRGGSRRAFWLGFALFGWGYLLQLVGGPIDRPIRYSHTTVVGGFGKGFGDSSEMEPQSALARVLDAFYPMIHQDTETEAVASLPGWFGSWFGGNTAIDRALDMRISMPFAKETPLEDVFKYLKAATQSPELPDGLPIYVDPAALQEAEKTLLSPITLELEGVPMRTSLGLLLRQLDLKYVVHDGLVEITYVAARRGAEEARPSFHTLGHCYFALLAGLVGGWIGRSFQATSKRALSVPSA